MKDIKQQIIESLIKSINDVKIYIDYYFELYRKNKISKEKYYSKITKLDNKLYELQTELKNYEN